MMAIQNWLNHWVCEARSWLWVVRRTSNIKICNYFIFICFYLSATVKRREICWMFWDIQNSFRCSQHLYLWNQVICHQTKELPTAMLYKWTSRWPNRINLDLRCLDPTKWGWKLEKNDLVAIKMDINPATDFLMNFIRCKCKIKTKIPFGTTHCSCRKHSLKSEVTCND